MRLSFFWLGLLLPLVLPAQENVEIRKEIDKLIRFESNLDLDNLPSFIISIVDEDSIYHLGYGAFRSDSSDVDIENLQFQLGGLTKVFTAHLCQILEDELISFDIHSYLTQVSPALNQITLEELLSHTSGLPKLPDNLGASLEDKMGRYANYSRQDFNTFLQEVSPGDKSHRYSHVNYALVQMLLEEMTRSSFSEMIHKHLFAVYNMPNSGIGAPPRPLDGHSRSGRITNLWKFSSFEASEGMYSSAADLTAYMQKCLSDGPSVESFAELLPPITKIPNSKRSYCGKAWHFFEQKGHRIYLHSGKTDGQGGVIQFVPETRTAVIILTNKIDSFQGLGMEVLRMINYNWKRQETDG